VTLHKPIDQDKIMDEVYTKVKKITQDLDEKLRQQNSKISLISSQVDTLNNQMIEAIVKSAVASEEPIKSDRPVSQKSETVGIDEE
jgi:division protein CdvB (Snf7/Vps24/ESCRT-III family)